MLGFKPGFSLFSFTFIKRLLSSSSFSVIRVVSFAYLKLLIFLPAILIPACALSSQAFLMMYSAYKLNKQGLMYSFSYLESVSCSISSSNCCFLTCIQISQEAGQVVWYSHLLKNFPQFVVVHTDKGFGIVNKAEVDIFLELLLFRWASRCWRFDLWFLCFFQIQLEHLEVHGSLTVEAWLGEYEQSISDAISVYKGCCGHWVISYCRCPRMCTLRGFRMKSNRILALNS